jgi:hypothetical protein
MKDFLSLFLSGLAVYLFQVPVDYGGWVAPILAALAAAITAYSHIRQKKIETKQSAQDTVIKAWERLFDQKQGEMRDIRTRLRDAERHIRICDKTQMKLVMQLMKQGVDVDLDTIWKEIEAFELSNSPTAPDKKDG